MHPPSPDHARTSTTSAPNTGTVHPWISSPERLQAAAAYPWLLPELVADTESARALTRTIDERKPLAAALQHWLGATPRALKALRALPVDWGKLHTLPEWEDGPLNLRHLFLTLAPNDWAQLERRHEEWIVAWQWARKHWANCCVGTLPDGQRGQLRALLAHAVWRRHQCSSIVEFPVIAGQLSELTESVAAAVPVSFTGSLARHGQPLQLSLPAADWLLAHLLACHSPKRLARLLDRVRRQFHRALCRTLQALGTQALPEWDGAARTVGSRRLIPLRSVGEVLQQAGRARNCLPTLIPGLARGERCLLAVYEGRALLGHVALQRDPPPTGHVVLVEDCRRLRNEAFEPDFQHEVIMAFGDGPAVHPPAAASRSGPDELGRHYRQAQLEALIEPGLELFAQAQHCRGLVEACASLDDLEAAVGTGQLGIIDHLLADPQRRLVPPEGLAWQLLRHSQPFRFGSYHTDHAAGIPGLLHWGDIPSKAVELVAARMTCRHQPLAFARRVVGSHSLDLPIKLKAVARPIQDWQVGLVMRDLDEEWQRWNEILAERRAGSGDLLELSARTALRLVVLLGLLYRPLDREEEADLFRTLLANARQRPGFEAINWPRGAVLEARPLIGFVFRHGFPQVPELQRIGERIDRRRELRARIANSV